MEKSFVLLHASTPVIDPGAASGIFHLLWLVIALPAFGAAVLLLGGRRTDRWGHWLGVATVAAAFLFGLVMFFGLTGRSADARSVHQDLWQWFSTGHYKVEFGLL